MLTARTAGSTLVFLAAFAALLHSDAALAADPPDVSQHHHTANIVFGEQPPLRVEKEPQQQDRVVTNKACANRAGRFTELCSSPELHSQAQHRLPVAVLQETSPARTTFGATSPLTPASS